MASREVAASKLSYPRAGVSMSPILSVSAVTKTYKSGEVALREIDLAEG
jgi:hypothetical protein